jgi:TnsA-like endonuclease N terminal/TnsA endonuclease C terminal
VPVRSIPKNYRSLTGKVIDFRSQSAVAFESALERDLYLLIDFDDAVARFEEQPVTIPYRDPAGVSRTYTPDVLVYYHSGLADQQDRQPVLYEVKYRDDLRANWGDYKPKFKAARRYARVQGWTFRLITEREIRTPYLKNAKFLREYRHRTLDSGDCCRVLAMLAERCETDPEALLVALSDDRWERARLLPVLWQLIAVRQAGADLTVPLTMRSRIWSLAPREERCDELIPQGHSRRGGHRRGTTLPDQPGTGLGERARP